jgi:hypothetical protein
MPLVQPLTGRLGQHVAQPVYVLSQAHVRDEKPVSAEVTGPGRCFSRPQGPAVLSRLNPQPAAVAAWDQTTLPA